MICAIVLRHLNPILMFVCLNRLVIFRTCREEKVQVAHFVLLSWFAVGGGFVFLCCICCFSLCSKVFVKLLGVAMRSMVCHSLSCQVWLRERFSILSM